MGGRRIKKTKKRYDTDPVREKRLNKLRRLANRMLMMAGEKTYHTVKDAYRQFPQVFNPQRKKNEQYLLARALLHLYKHFNKSEIAIITKRPRKWIKAKLKELIGGENEREIQSKMRNKRMWE